jgi:hypothetical protein
MVYNHELWNETWSMYEFDKKYKSGGKTWRKMSTRKTTLEWMDNININLNEIGWVFVDLIHLVQVRCPVVDSSFSWETELLTSQQNIYSMELVISISYSHIHVY